MGVFSIMSMELGNMDTTIVNKNGLLIPVYPNIRLLSIT